MAKNQLIEQLKKQIEGLPVEANIEEVGTVVEVGDGIARVSGLLQCQYSEMIEFENGAYGVALNLEETSVGVVVLGDYKTLKEGNTAKRTKRILSIPVDEKCVGRVLNPLGEPVDGKGKIPHKTFYPIEKISPGVITRQSVHQPVQTGIKAIDSMIPVGRGQRELIIGDRQTGKTAVAIDTIINQKGQDMICIYVAIGQNES